MKDGDQMYKVLIIDDELNNRLLLEEILEDYDKPLKIMTAEFGDEGLEMIKNKKPDVVFLDMMLPILNGIQICKIVKKELKIEDVKIILISAMNNLKNIDVSNSALIDEYLQKPYKSSQVINILNNTLDMESGG